MLWRQTDAAWQQAVPALDSGLAPRDTRRSYAVLAGLTSHSGGMVAAATTSLPERAEAGRNYDYRYVWIRDLCYAGQAVAAHGPDHNPDGGLLDRAVGFVAERLLSDGPKLAPAYTTTGEPVPDQISPQPARLPRRRRHHRQLGQPAVPTRRLRRSPPPIRRSRSPRPTRRPRLDSSPHRRRRDHPTLDRTRRRHLGNRQPPLDPQPPHRRCWTTRRRRGQPHRQLCCGMAAAGRSPRRRHRRPRPAPDRALATLPRRPGLDAALLLPGLRGAVAPDDPRTPATLHAYLRDLTLDGYAYRFRHDDRPLPEAEGSFLLCGFLVAMSLHQHGQPVQARAWFERTRAASGPPQLFSEEYDATQHQMRGNLPQAFVHALAIEAAARLTQADQAG